MRRSLLFIPGNRINMLQKSENSDADIIIFDLEDSISEKDKKKGREILINFLSNFENKAKKEIVIRINSAENLWLEDISETIKSGKIDIYMIPKANVEIVRKTDHYIQDLENKMNFSDKKIKLIPLIETPQGIIDAHNIAKSSPRNIGMLFGAEDFATQMNINRTVTGEEILIARSIFTMACSAAGIDSYDTPFTDTKNMNALEFDTNKGKSLGMTGKAAIHPSQIEIIHKVYTAPKSEIEKALRIIKENEAAQKDGKGSFQIDGEMIDLPIVLRARKLLNDLGINID